MSRLGIIAGLASVRPRKNGAHEVTRPAAAPLAESDAEKGAKIASWKEDIPLILTYSRLFPDFQDMSNQQKMGRVVRKGSTGHKMIEKPLISHKAGE